MGRPRRKIDLSEKEIDQLKTLARCHCTDKEIAAYCGLPETILQRYFGATLKEQRDVGRSNLRAKQFKMAMEGNVTMLIWLGKQILGQRDGELTPVDEYKDGERVFTTSWAPKHEE